MTDSARPTSGSTGARSKIICLSVAHLFHDIYTSFLAPVLPLLIEKFALSYAAAGFLSVLMRIPSFASPLVGSWADRFRLKYIVIISPALTAAAMCLIGRAPNYGALSVLIVFAGLSSTCFHVPAPVLITQVAGQRPGAAMSLFQVGGELSRTIGPLVVLGAVSIWSLEGLYRLVPLGVLTSLLLHWALREVPGAVRSPARSSGNGRAAALLRADWPFWAALFGILVCKSCVASVVAAFLPVYLTAQGTSLWLSGGALSLLQAAALAGVCITGWLSDRIGCTRMLAVLTLATPLIMLLFVFAHGWLLSAALVLLGLIAFSSTPVVLSLIQQRCRDYPATANGVYMMMSFTMGAVTVMLAGMLSDRIGIAAALKMFAACSFIGLPFLLLLPRKGSQDMTRCDGDSETPC
jgi:MFS transporter, FSR family, fosmidomycin resistance protein